MTLLTNFHRALIRWIPEHMLGIHSGYSLGALRETSNELRQAADRIENSIDSAVAGGAIPPDEPRVPDLLIQRVIVAPDPERQTEQ